jgi:hypothetical protein
MINKIKKVFKILCVFIISICLSSCNNTLDNKRQYAINYVNGYANEIRLYEDIILDSNEFNVYIQHNINKLTNSQTKASIDYIVEEFNNDINNYLVCSLETALKLKQGYVDYSLNERKKTVDINTLEIYKYIGEYNEKHAYIVIATDIGYLYGPTNIAGYDFYIVHGFDIVFLIEDEFYFNYIKAYNDGMLSDNDAIDIYNKYIDFCFNEYDPYINN